MPLKVERGPHARRDILAIWDYIAADSGRGAEAVLRRINRIVGDLAEHPALGRERPELGDGIRSFPAAGSYLVYYRYSATTLRVLRILHTARDVTPKLFD